MIIILEGENKCGKTTLANYLSKKLNAYDFKYKKFNQPKGDPYIEYLSFLKRARGNYIIDRFHWGELVYGPIYRGKSQLSEKQFINIEMKLQALNTVVVYCHDKSKNIEKRFIEDNERWARIELIGHVLDRYHGIQQKTILPVIQHQIKTRYDLTVENMLINYVRSHHRKQLNFNVIGKSLYPELLLVGDQHNDNNHKLYFNVKLPFDFGMSSNHLYEVLKLTGIPLNQIAIINSKDNGKTLEQKLKLIKPLKTVALGNKAAGRLRDLNALRYLVNHPGYEKRFNLGIINYVDKIRRIYDAN